MTEPTKKEINLELDFSRLISVYGDITEESVAPIIGDLIEAKLTDPDKPITLLVNTGGGDVFEAYAIYDLIKLLQLEVIVLAVGKVMSAGFIIMAAGTQRLATSHTTFMTHNMSTLIPPEMSDVKKIQSSCVSTLEMNQNMVKMLSKSSSLSEEEAGILCNEETYFGSKMALKYGLIDGVIDTDVMEILNERTTATKSN